MYPYNWKDVVFAGFGALSLALIAAIVLSPIGQGFRSSQPVEGVASLGSRAGPLADQISIRGDTVGRRTGSDAPSTRR